MSCSFQPSAHLHALAPLQPAFPSILSTVLVLDKHKITCILGNTFLAKDNLTNVCFLLLTSPQATDKRVHVLLVTTNDSSLIWGLIPYDFFFFKPRQLKIQNKKSIPVNSGIPFLKDRAKTTLF